MPKFQKGNTFGKGRPPGSRNEFNQKIEELLQQATTLEEKEAVIDHLHEMAASEDSPDRERANRWLLKHYYPPGLVKLTKMWEQQAGTEGNPAGDAQPPARQPEPPGASPEATPPRTRKPRGKKLPG